MFRAISRDKMAHLFSLTDAEAEVCHDMIAGLSATEIAEARHVSEETVKAQFKSIYLTTGVHRRTELLRLEFALDPPIG